MESDHRKKCELRKAFKSMKVKSDAEKRLSERLNQLIQSLEMRRQDYNNHLQKLAADRQVVQNLLNISGLSVSSLDDFKLMTELWESGYEDFDIQMDRPMSQNLVDRMEKKYELDFSFWDTEYEYMSDLKLSDELEYFENQYWNQLVHYDRLTHINKVIAALQTEEKRRKIEEERRKAASPIIQKRDSYRSSKD